MLFTKHMIEGKKTNRLKLKDGNSYTRLTGTKELKWLKSNKIEFKTELILEKKENIT